MIEEPAIGLMALFLGVLLAFFIVAKLKGRAPIWIGGAPMSPGSQITTLLFVALLLIGAVSESSAYFLFAVLTFAVGWCLQWSETRNFHRRKRELRDRNAAAHPEALSSPPPSCEPDQLPYEMEFQAFNNTTGKPIGTLRRDQLYVLLSWYSSLGLADRNDLFLLREAIESLEPYGAKQDLIDMLLAGLDDDPDMELRWTY